MVFLMLILSKLISYIKITALKQSTASQERQKPPQHRWEHEALQEADSTARRASVSLKTFQKPFRALMGRRLPLSSLSNPGQAHSTAVAAQPHSEHSLEFPHQEDAQPLTFKETKGRTQQL